ncbi:MAG: hypothetical protein DLM72_17420 [Candidatus Nitrosopolaris wilkensis]|nr:MAG: hypothetical protein DLM72_17420 [Candidatus Nitrosopolaris wilkensis]
MIDAIDVAIEDKLEQIQNIKEKQLQRELKKEIKDLQRQKSLYSKAVKLIDLDSKVLALLDTPDYNLLANITPILSHLEEEKIEEFNKIRQEGDVALYLRKVDLSGKDLRGVDLHEADLSETKLIATKLTMSNLNGAKLKGADLSGADLRSADLYGAFLSGANLTRADVRGADLKVMIDFADANLTRADIRGVDLAGMVNFAGATLHDVDFTRICH